MEIPSSKIQISNKYQWSKFKIDGFVKSRGSLENVIPAPHQVRDKLQPVEDSDLSENPVNSITSGCRIKSGMTVLGFFRYYQDSKQIE
jgi:hypothetical protein